MSDLVIGEIAEPSQAVGMLKPFGHFDLVVAKLGDPGYDGTLLYCSNPRVGQRVSRAIGLDLPFCRFDRGTLVAVAQQVAGGIPAICALLGICEDNVVSLA